LKITKIIRRNTSGSEMKVKLVQKKTLGCMSLWFTNLRHLRNVLLSNDTHWGLAWFLFSFHSFFFQ